MSEPRLRYLLLSGSDDAAFCKRVSDALDDGYVLHGSPSVAISHGDVLVVQALLLETTDQATSGEDPR